METFDGRKLDHKTLEQLRIRAVQRVLDGEAPETVIKALGFAKPRICEWLAKYRRGGWEALKAKAIPGRPRKVTAAQTLPAIQALVIKENASLYFCDESPVRGGFHSGTA